jgi:histidine phosphotransferase ChpT
MTDQTDLAALLGSRICHDLISPIGAIGNGVELMMMEGGPPSPELVLIAESVAAANARIRLFRVAFGLSGGTQRIGRAELTKILSDSTLGSRTSIVWQPTADIPRNEAKLAFLAILCCDSALAFGGRTAISLADGKWQVHANAKRLRIEPELWDSLAQPALGIAPSQVHFALFAREIAQQKRRLMTEISETDIRLSF